jgi:peptide/nickel transport system substrate-binding protein
VFFGDTLQRRKFDGLAFFTWVESPESVPRHKLHSGAIPSAANGFSGQNYGGYRNAEMDSLIDRIEHEADRERRRPLWQRFQALYAEDLPALPLFFNTRSWILPLWLDGVVPSGHSAVTTLGVERWRAK